jgi:hypothetical protein
VAAYLLDLGDQNFLNLSGYADMRPAAWLDVHAGYFDDAK